MATESVTAPPKTPLELLREVVQLHFCIVAAMRELSDLTEELFQRLGDEPKGGGQ